MTHLSPETPNRREPEISSPLVDTRAAFIGSRLNPMVRVALDYIVDD